MKHPEILIVVFFVMLTTFGVVRRNRIFQFGLFLYGLSVFTAEINQYLEIQSFSHLLFAILFLIKHFIGAE